MHTWPTCSTCPSKLMWPNFLLFYYQQEIPCVYSLVCNFFVVFCDYANLSKSINAYENCTVNYFFQMSQVLLVHGVGCSGSLDLEEQQDFRSVSKCIMYVCEWLQDAARFSQNNARNSNTSAIVSVGIADKLMAFINDARQPVRVCIRLFRFAWDKLNWNSYIL